MIEDSELLRRYAEQKSEQAFAEFVQRHVNFVYGCALRRVDGDEHFAKDVTQQVFVSAAREAPRLSHHPVVTGWLFTTARNVAVQLIRTERRRRLREQQAHAMEEQNDSQPAIDWVRLRPVIDEALDGLGETDRQAVLLRFFENKSFAEVGRRLRLAENAARMRVDRALGKMSATLGRHGVTSTAAALAVALSSQGGVAAPAGLAAAATGAALASSVAGTTAGLIGFMGMTKLQIGLAGALVVAGATGLTIQARQAAALRRDLMQTEPQVRATADVAAENARLKQAQADALHASQARATELVRLREQIGLVRDQMARAEASRKTAGAESGRPAVGESAKVYDVAVLDVVPKPVFRESPKYPMELRRAGTTGEAVVDFVVDQEGRVQNAFAANGTDPEFVDAAVQAVEAWKFEPGKKAGVPVMAHLQIPIVFTLTDKNAKSAATPESPKPAEQIPWF